MSGRFGIVILVLSLAVIIALTFGRPFITRVYVKLAGGRTVQDVAERYGPSARARLAPGFESFGLAYPPDRVTLIALKREKRLEVWVPNQDEWSLVKTYPICAASGDEGPKLKEGDLQVPEGVYPLTVLNPESGFHLSIRIEYPNDHDKAMALQDNRTDLGGDIYLHGKCVSVGCLAMGDEAIEELFILTHDVGLENMEIIIAPADLRNDLVKVDSDQLPPWTDELYGMLRAKLSPFGSADGVR
jgi:hypothetical protein